MFDATQTVCFVGLLGELCTLIFKECTVSDLYHAYIRNGPRFDRLRGPLRRFAISNVLQDGPHTNDNIAAAVDRLMVSVRERVHNVLVSAHG